MNITMLRGRLSRAPEARELPSGDRLVAYEVTVVNPGQRADSVPVVWHDPPAAALKVGAGDDVVVVGRVRRRFFRAGGLTQSRTEVVAEAVLNARHAKRCRVVIGCAGDSYDAEVKIDGKPAFELGGLATPLASGLAVMEIAPGQHSVEVASISSEAKFSAATELVCGAGDRRYVALRLKHDDAATGYGSSRKFVGQLEVSGEMPEEFQDRGLLIWGNGRWLVPAEPGQ